MKSSAQIGWTATRLPLARPAMPISTVPLGQASVNPPALPKGPSVVGQQNERSEGQPSSTTPSQSSSRSLQNSMLSLHVHSPARQTIPLSPQERPSQSASAQSTRPSQSSSLPSPQMRSVKPLGQGQVPEAVHVAPPGPHTAPPQSGSAQSTRPSQSSSAPSPQLV